MAHEAPAPHSRSVPKELHALWATRGVWAGPLCELRLNPAPQAGQPLSANSVVPPSGGTSLLSAAADAPPPSPVHGMLVDEVGGWSLDAAVQRFLGSMQMRPNDRRVNHTNRKARGRRVRQECCGPDNLCLKNRTMDSTCPRGAIVARHSDVGDPSSWGEVSTKVSLTAATSQCGLTTTLPRPAALAAVSSGRARHLADTRCAVSSVYRIHIWSLSPRVPSRTPRPIRPSTRVAGKSLPSPAPPLHLPAATQLQRVGRAAH